MARTPDQIEADDNLRAAIEAVLVAYDITSDGRVMMEYLVLTAAQRIEPTGETTTKYDYLMPDEGRPWHTIMGLIRTHLILLEAEMREAAE